MSEREQRTTSIEQLGHGLPVEEAVLLDDVCDAFESKWRAGGQPDIASAVVELPEAVRPVAVRELVALDVFYRRRLRENPVSADYATRFPELNSEWLARLVSDVEPAGNSTATGESTESTVELLPGVRIGYFGDYELLSEIARGGMGVVYRATDKALGREVAVKVLQDKFSLRSVTAHRFTDEARIAAQLQHPGIPPVHELGKLPDGRPFLAMKLIKGRTLDDLLKDHTELSTDRGRFLAVFEQVCQAVAYAHSLGVIHRDLKPANVMVGNFAEVQVMDWGLAKVLSDTHDTVESHKATVDGLEVHTVRDGDDQFTQAGTILGTPAFMPPEQAIGAIEQINARSDVFGLGGILAMILTGRPPYQGETAESTRQLAAKGNLKDCFARLDVSGADPELANLCKLCLSAKMDHRPADAGAVAKAVAVADLRSAADERARVAELDLVRIEGEKTAAEVKSIELGKRRRVQAALAMTITALVGLAGLAFWWSDRKLSERRREQEVLEIRTATEVRGLLDQAKLALARDEILPADLALVQVDARLGDAGHVELRAEYERHRTDREMLVRIRDIDDLRWIDPGSDANPPENPTGPQFAAAFRWYGLTLTPQARNDEAERVRGSAIREQLVAALDSWLAVGADDPSGLTSLLEVLDSNDLRREYRRTIANRDFQKLRELIRRPDVTRLPPQFLVSVLPLRNRQIPHGEILPVLKAAWTANPSEFRFAFQIANLMRDRYLGAADPIDQKIGYFRAAVAARPTNVTALTALGNILWERREIVEAIQVLERAKSLDPSFTDAGYHLALSYSLNRDWVKAENTLAATAARDPKPARIEFNRARNAEFRGNREGAINHYRRTSELDPNWPEPHYRLALALRNRGDLEGAIASIRRIIDLQPSWANAYEFLAQVYESKGQTANAITSLREGIKVDPTYPNFSSRLCPLLLMTGDADGAVMTRRKAIELHPALRTPQFIIRPSAVPPADRERVIASTRRVIQLEPKFAEAHALLGYLLVISDRPNEAVGVYANAMETVAAHHFRYNAACAAVRAGTGRGKDAPPASERPALRHRALKWLTSELVIQQQKYDDNLAMNRAQVSQRLSQWLTDKDFIGVRPGPQKFKMSAEEQVAWDNFWREVRELRDAAQKSTKS